MGSDKIKVADALFSKVHQRILGLIFGQPQRVFYTNEIIRLTKSGTGAVQRGLAKLSSVGLILTKKSGNQIQYQANVDSFIFSELRNIVIKTFGVVDVIKEALSPIAPQIKIAFIYGSIAKEEDKTDSDIDLMVIGDKLGYAELYPLLEGPQEKLGRQINPSCYSLEEWSRKLNEGNNFINQIIKQPKIFLLGSKDELISLR